MTHRHGETISIINRSSDWAALALQGPNVRAVLAKCTDASLHNTAFRWLWDGNGGEAIRMGNTIGGSTSSIAFGHTLGKVLAFAYVQPQAAVPGTVLDVFLNEAWRSAVVLGEAAIDPQSLLPRTDAVAEELPA